MLGTFYNSRGPIAGIGITFIMVGLMLKWLYPLPDHDRYTLDLA